MSKIHVEFPKWFGDVKIPPEVVRGRWPDGAAYLIDSNVNYNVEQMAAIDKCRLTGVPQCRHTDTRHIATRWIVGCGHCPHQPTWASKEVVLPDPFEYSDY